MPTLTWKLKDPESCEWCPFTNWATEECELPKCQGLEWDCNDNKRPQQCIDELGK
jgi:hypothetical protein